MVTKTVAIYVFFDDILKSMNHKEPESRKTTDAEIITVVLLAAQYFLGNKHDLDGLKQLPVNLPEGSEVLADCAYTDYRLEDMLADNGVNLLAARKSNSKHPHNPCKEYLISIGRKNVETAFSDIVKYMPKKIHAVTDYGFLIKLIAFIWGYTIYKLYNL